MGAMWGHVIRFTEGATERFCNVGIGLELHMVAATTDTPLPGRKREVD